MIYSGTALRLRKGIAEIRARGTCSGGFIEINVMHVGFDVCGRVAYMSTETFF